MKHRPDLPEQLLPDVQTGVDFYARDFLPGIPVANMSLCGVDLEKIRLNYVSDFIADVPDLVVASLNTIEGWNRLARVEKVMSSA